MVDVGIYIGYDVVVQIVMDILYGSGQYVGLVMVFVVDDFCVFYVDQWCYVVSLFELSGFFICDELFVGKYLKEVFVVLFQNFKQFWMYEWFVVHDVKEYIVYLLGFVDEFVYCWQIDGLLF